MVEITRNRRVATGRSPVVPRIIISSRPLLFPLQGCTLLWTKWGYIRIKHCCNTGDLPVAALHR